MPNDKPCRGGCGGAAPPEYKLCPGCQEGADHLNQLAIKRLRERVTELEKGWVAGKDWKTKDGLCTVCGYDLLTEERTSWAWCFMCGNGSPVHAAILEATQRVFEKAVPVLVRKNPTELDVNNYLLVPLSVSTECPNCNEGTIEKVGNDLYRCRGPCGAYFHGPCQHPNRNMNGGCDDCGDPSL